MMNIQKMMAQAKQMQEKMQKLQDDLANVEVEGSSGGGMVNVVITCKGDCRKIDIAPELILPEDKEVLEDLIKAALNDAKAKADRTLGEETQKLMKELGLPAGAMGGSLPF